MKMRRTLVQTRLPTLHGFDDQASMTTAFEGRVNSATLARARVALPYDYQQPYMMPQVIDR